MAARRAHASRVPGIILALLVASLATVAAPASAQGLPPALTACGPFEIVPVEGAVSASGGGRAFVSAKAVNGGRLPGTATVDAVIVGGDGWTVTPASQSTSAIDAGANGTVSFTIEAAEGASEFGSLELKGRLECAGGGGTAAAYQAQPARVSLSVADGSTGGLGALSNALSRMTEDPVAALTAGGLLLAGVLAVFAVARMRRPTTGVTVRADEVEKRVRPGRGTSFPVHVANAGEGNERLRFDVADVPAGWTAFMAVPEITLAGNESRTVWLMVRAPPGAPQGDRAEISVTVRAGEDGSRARDVRVLAIVDDAAHDAES